ncbi:MAG: hypothetical protein GF398_01715 [Chitinivibrionales bacterium]|nr:hypothetical protein [Chitinivibrionales bacterium]
MSCASWTCVATRGFPGSDFQAPPTIRWRENSMAFKAGLFAQSAAAKQGTFRPQLTSLIDVMTILLVFLIKSFSVEGHLVTPSEDLELPLSTSKDRPKPAVTIEITRDAVVAEGEVLAITDVFTKTDSLLIPQLHDWMLLQKSKETDISSTREVLIQSDKDIEFSIIKRVMYTCSKAGFADFSVLVLEAEL